jgi:hypothetical protein
MVLKMRPPLVRCLVRPKLDSSLVIDIGGSLVKGSFNENRHYRTSEAQGAF